MSFENFTTIVEYRNVSFNSGLSDDLFEFSPPENVKIVEKTFELPEKLTIEEAQRKVNFTIVLPSYTAGYEFEYAMLFGDSVQLIYSKGDGRIVITESLTSSPLGLNFSEINVNGRKAEIAEILDTKVLRINVGGVEVTIAAKLSEEELLKVAGSLGQSAIRLSLYS